MVRQAVCGKALRPEVRQLRRVGIPGRRGGGGGGLSDSAAALVAAAILLVARRCSLLTFRARPVMLPLALGARRDGDHARRPVAAGRVVLRGGRGRDAAAVRRSAQGGRSSSRGGSMRRRQIAAGSACLGARIRTLLISPVSMARSFGALIAVGLVVSFVLALTAGAAVIGGASRRWRARFAPVGRRARRSGIAARRCGRRVAGPHRADRTARAGRGRRRAGALAADRARSPGGAVACAHAFPRSRAPSANVGGPCRRRGRPARACRADRRAAWRLRVTGPAAYWRRACAVSSRVAGSNPDRRHVGPGPPAADDRVEARDLASIERETGTPGDVNVIVRSERLLDPAVVRWMSSYQRRVLRQNGFRAGRPCREADLCPALSLDEPVRIGQAERTPDPGGRRGAATVLLPERDHPRIAGPRTSPSAWVRCRRRSAGRWSRA